jgi:hypothetical protein
VHERPVARDITRGEQVVRGTQPCVAQLGTQLTAQQQRTFLVRQENVVLGEAVGPVKDRVELLAHQTRALGCTAATVAWDIHVVELWIAALSAGLAFLTNPLLEIWVFILT